MDVNLSPELERFVREQVDTGKYRTASDVVRDGLRVLAEQTELQSLRAEFNEKIAEAEADVAAGRMIDGSEVRERLRQRCEALEAELRARTS